MSIMIPIAWGELIDKITILEIKQQRISDPSKRANIDRELTALVAARDAAAGGLADIETETAELRRVNEALWDIEDDIRDCERGKTFDAKFIELARAVYRTNDKRSVLKRRINEIRGSAIIEEKSYASYE